MLAVRQDPYQFKADLARERLQQVEHRWLASGSHAPSYRINLMDGCAQASAQRPHRLTGGRLAPGRRANVDVRLRFP
ncbi:hypothetical protein GCM10008939_20440 [Deinococcus aquiradiocola]|uniref:Uncharacterized protein n=1 Tax=Deinococcus aquiradiocola TaxID=393059 RepID=A0A917UQJ9_9DEIO|nr:hypothetical protein GCM10008939_20440 [Deinococcus aquiradiocola]